MVLAEVGDDGVGLAHRRARLRAGFDDQAVLAGVVEFDALDDEPADVPVVVQRRSDAVFGHADQVGHVHPAVRAVGDTDGDGGALDRFAAVRVLTDNDALLLARGHDLGGDGETGTLQPRARGIR